VKTNSSIEQSIEAEIKKIPTHLCDNFLFRATINSMAELGAEGVLDQLKDINRYARRRSANKKFSLTKRLKGNARAGNKAPAPSQQRKAK
jgi:hypothetical protein